jgi:hypothetical protein
MSKDEPLTRGDVAVAVQMGTIAISWSAENVSWAPDVVKDMQNRTMDMLREMLVEANKYDLIGSLPDMVEVDVEDGDE